jgi:hypothetical protein
MSKRRIGIKKNDNNFINASFRLQMYRIILNNARKKIFILKFFYSKRCKIMVRVLRKTL